MSGERDRVLLHRAGQPPALKHERTIPEAANRPPEPAARDGSRAEDCESADLVVRSAAMREAYDLARNLASSDIPVLIQGETGVGKGVIAEFIRSCGPSQDSPFLWLNCGSIPPQLAESTFFGHERGAFTGATERSKGMFEAAHGGTLVLDEIGELCPSAQAALLRVLDTRRFSRVGSTRELQVNVRILAATHRDLDQMCARNEFRRDLLYRINAGVISIPPLRERPEDIEPLALHFLDRLGQPERHRRTGTGIDQQAMRLMKEYVWPGNVRELHNAIRGAAAVADGHQLSVNDLPASVRGGGRRAASENPSPSPQFGHGSERKATRWDLRARMKEYEAALFRAALEKTRGNKTECAQLLQIPYRTCVRRIKLLRV